MLTLTQILKTFLVEMKLYLLRRKLCEVLLLVEPVQQLSKKVTAGEVLLKISYFLSQENNN